MSDESVERTSLLPPRRDFINEAEMDVAAETFVRSIGVGNAEFLRANLRLTIAHSDALRALNRALLLDFNITRQEQIRRAQMARRAS